MKKLIILLALVAISHSIVFSQGCLPEGITFSTQEQIDNFQTIYPGCTEIEGDVTIFSGSYITNLNGLSVLTSIGGDLELFANHSLTNLAGLEGVTSIGGSLTILHNNALINLTGLEGLTSIGSYLNISYSDALINLVGLEGLTSIGSYLNISYHDSLSSLTGLDNIQASSITELTIVYNPILAECNVYSICEYLALPNGGINIINNAPGCNSQEEVEEACLTVVKENITNGEITISPNPATSFITINTKEGILIEEAIIYNHLGQKVLETKSVNNTVDVSMLKPGIYILEVITKNRIIREKLLIE
jgi:hypothetical protein